MGYSRFINEGTDLWEALDLAIEALSEPKTIIGIDIPYGSDKGVATIFKGKGEKLILEEVKEIMSVVRCKDCMYCNVVNTKDAYAYCIKHGFTFYPFQDDTRKNYCSWAEAKKSDEKHQLTEETSTNTSTNSNKNSKDNLSFLKKGNDDLISRQGVPPVNQEQIIDKLKNAENATSEDEESTMNQPKSKLESETHEIRTETHGVCSDCISRDGLLFALEPMMEDWEGMKTVKLIIETIPPVTPTEQQEHGRLIDADYLLQETFTVDEEKWTTPEIRAILENAPNITPTERTGEWVKVSGYVTPGGDPVWECSECGKGRHVYGVEVSSYQGDVSDQQWVTCPNCGARMNKGGDTE